VEQAVPILFYCLAVLAVVGAAGVLVFGQPIRAAWSLVFTINAVALLFLMRGAVLLAVIHALFACFGAVYLWRSGASQSDDSVSTSPVFVPEVAPLAIVAGVLFGVVVSLGLIFGVPAPGQGDGTALRSMNGEEWGNVIALCSEIMTAYLVPLLVVLVTLIVALCGARRLMGGRLAFASGKNEAEE